MSKSRYIMQLFFYVYKCKTNYYPLTENTKLKTNKIKCTMYSLIKEPERTKMF